MNKLEDMSLEELWQLFPIVLQEHSPKYAIWYKQEKKHLLKVLKDYNISGVNHIGSTAVKGLIAKPIVDILMEMSSPYQLNDLADLLRAEDWIVMAQNDAAQTLDLNKGYTANGFAERVFHLHVKPIGDWDELYFRDYLQEFPKVALQYAALKQALKNKFEHNRDAYTSGKTEFVRNVVYKAREEFTGRYLPSER